MCVDLRFFKMWNHLVTKELKGFHCKLMRHTETGAVHIVINALHFDIFQVFSITSSGEPNIMFSRKAWGA